MHLWNGIWTQMVLTCVYGRYEVAKCVKYTCICVIIKVAPGCAFGLLPRRLTLVYFFLSYITLCYYRMAAHAVSEYVILKVSACGSFIAPSFGTPWLETIFCWYCGNTWEIAFTATEHRRGRKKNRLRSECCDESPFYRHRCFRRQPTHPDTQHTRSRRRLFPCKERRDSTSYFHIQGSVLHSAGQWSLLDTSTWKRSAGRDKFLGGIQNKG